MTSPVRIVWKGRPPRRAIARLGWVAAGAVLVLGPAALLFGQEPPRVDSGRVNPLSMVVPALGVLFGALALPGIVGLVRRPVLAADGYALTVRAGCGRILLLPWSQLVELAAVPVRDQPVLLIRCGTRRAGTDFPGWWDRGVLRAVRRSGLRDPVARYDVALLLRDFGPEPYVVVESLASFAPPHLILVSRV